MHQSNTKKEHLWSKNYLFVIVAGGLFMIIHFALISFAPAYMVQSGYSSFMAGLQNTLYSMFCVVFRFYYAPLADIRGRKRLMQLGALAFAAGALTFYLSAGSFAVVVLARALMGLGMASYLSAASCYVTEIVPIQKRGVSIGIQRSVYSLSLMLGPAGAVEIIRSPYGYRGLFLTLMVTGLIAFLLVTMVRDAYQPQKKRVNLVHIFKEYAHLLKNKQVAQIYIMLLALCLAYGAVLSFATLYLSGFEGISNVGLFFTFYSIGGLAGNLIGGSSADRYSLKTLAITYAIVSGLGTSALILIPLAPFTMMWLTGLVGGFGFTAALTVTINWLIDIVPVENKGAALGLQESSIDGGIALGSLVFGLLTFIWTQGLIFLVMGLLSISVPIWIAMSLPKPEQV